MKHVVITGATRGLGRAMAQRFAQDGWRISGCGTDVALLSSLQEELGPSHCIRACDVTNSSEVDSFAAAVLEASGVPDLLLNSV